MDKKKRHLLTALLLLLVTYSIVWAKDKLPRSAQKIVASQDEMISMSSSMPFNQAIVLFSDLSKRHLDKIIVDQTNETGPIGVNINRMFWRDAYDLVLSKKGFEYQEYSDYISIRAPEKSESEYNYDGSEIDDIDYELNAFKDLYKTREVVISAIFFETNLNKLHQVGTSWNIINSDSNYTLDMSAGEGKASLLQFSGFKELDFGSILAVLKILSNDQMGEVLSCPQIV